MTLQINPKKPLESYTQEEQAAILERGKNLEKCEQGEERSLEDTFCLVARRRSLRAVNFKPTVEKIVKEKPLTKAQKLAVLEQVVKLGSLPLTDKQQEVVDELVGVGKEYYLIEKPLGGGNTLELVKLTKTNTKNLLKSLKEAEDVGVSLPQRAKEFLTAMTKEV